MTPLEQERFRAILIDLKQKLAMSLSLADPADASITPDDAIGRLTRMEALQAQAMGTETRRRQVQRLRQVERALEMIDEERYGTCVRCGREIQVERLEVMPETRLCVRCAARPK